MPTVLLAIDRVLHETDKARKYLAGESPSNDDDCFWVPLSLVENAGDEDADGYVEVLQWWAEKEGHV